MLRWRLTMVETAITWSGSVAWRMPRTNPKPIAASKFTMLLDPTVKPADSERFHCCCAQAKFREVWLFFTEKPCGHGALAYTYSENALADVH
jgi:hypothetical protein